MKKLINYAVIALTCIAFLGTSTTFGQEWSKEQKAVWQEVENGWSAWKSGDIDGAFKGIHEKYLGWNNDDPLPISKEKWRSMNEALQDYLRVDFYDIQPARIVVYGDNATVYYFFKFYTVFQKSSTRNENKLKGRNVEFYVKEDGKWMLFGDMTYFDEDDY